VTELVEASGEHRDHEDEEQQVRPFEGVVRRGAETPVEEHPAHHRNEADEDRRGDHGPEEHPERIGEPMGGLLVRDGEPGLESQQRVRTLELWL
jgi:hypothetical protein